MIYKMKRWGAAYLLIGVVLAGLVFVFSGVSLAQNQPIEPSATSTGQGAEREKVPSNERAENRTEQPVAKDTENRKSAPSFRPSEEISADSPVPFPIDI